MYIVNVYLDTLTIKIRFWKEVEFLNQILIMVKGLTALTILTYSFAQNISNQPHSIAKAKKLQRNYRCN